jgi:UDP-2,3-diacylglucosamine hydrolase
VNSSIESTANGERKTMNKKLSKTYFISDLHLDASRPKITQLFFNFLQNEASQADALYILGDFFEYWIGDDDQTKFIDQIKQALKNFTEKKIPAFLMVGNRDFLLGKRFAKETGCHLISDPSCISLYGEPILLMHGDSLCTLDVKHQKFRRFSRNKLYQKIFLSLPLTFRRKIAEKIRKKSESNYHHAQAEILDVTANEVTRMMQKFNVQCLIHGHTHKPNIHSLTLLGKSSKRIVLGDWHDNGAKILMCTPKEEKKLIILC